MKTLGFVMTVDMAIKFYERTMELEQNFSRPLSKEERQLVLVEMAQMNMAEAFISDDCPELVERKLMKAAKVQFVRAKKSPPPDWRESDDGEKFCTGDGA